MLTIRRNLTCRIAVATAFAIAASVATGQARAQTPPKKTTIKDAAAQQEKDAEKKDEPTKEAPSTPADVKSKPAKPTTQMRAPGKPGKIAPRPAKRSGLEVPEPTVTLKPGEVPAAKFDEPNYDFGRVRSGEDVKHTYYVTNTGTGPLEILRVKPSCGCTTAGEHTRVIQPGEVGQIPIKLSTKRGGTTISKTVTVNTNIPGKDGTIRLTIKGTVWHPVEVAPNNASFGRLTKAKAATEKARRLTIVNNVDGKMNPTNVRCNNPRFKAEIKPIEEGKKYELIVELVPPLDDGNNRGQIEIETGLAEFPKLEVAAFAYVTSPVDVTPSSLTLMPSRTGAMKRQFYIRSNDGSSFDIKNLRSTSGKLGLTHTEMSGTQKTYQLAVDIPADFAPAANEVIEFETTHPSVPKVSIPVRSRANQKKPMANTARRPINPLTPGNTGKSAGKPTVVKSDQMTEKEGNASAKPTDDAKKPAKPAEEMKPVG